MRSVELLLDEAMGRLGLLCFTKKRRKDDATRVKNVWEECVYVK